MSADAPSQSARPAAPSRKRKEQTSPDACAASHAAQLPSTLDDSVAQPAARPDDSAHAAAIEAAASHKRRAIGTSSSAHEQSAGDAADAHAADVAAAAAGPDPQMHPRSLYRHKRPDFLALAQQYPAFAPFVTSRVGPDGLAYGVVDWTDTACLHALTRVLLRHDFGLEFSMPRSNLCPPVPQRLNYMHWVAADLLELPADSKRADVRALDIGTGASCIFPLLGHATYGWRWLGTEVDADSVRAASSNVTANKLEEAIEVRHVPDRRRILDGVLRDGERFDVCVCNPPFFSTLAATGQNPSRAAAATPSELVCEGGEEAFVAQIIRESKATGCIRWCSTMLGRKSSLAPLVSLLHSASVRACVVLRTEFTQGAQTRWGLAWTFDEEERHKREARRQETQAQTGHEAQREGPSTTGGNAAANAAGAVAAAAADWSSHTARAKARFPMRVATAAAATSLTDRVQAAAASYAVLHSCALQCTRLGAFHLQMAMRATNAGDTPGNTKQTPAFSVECMLLQQATTEYLANLEWRKPPTSAAGPAVDQQHSRQAFAHFVAAIKETIRHEL